MDGKDVSEVPDGFFIWGIDDAPYGPVALAVVTDWIKDARVLPDTWIFARRTGVWQQASDVSELKKFFNQPTRGGFRRHRPRRHHARFPAPD